MTDLPKTFDPAAIEARWYAHWEERGLFRPDRPDAEPFTIVNPPPNVTGSLHIGHALDNTLQDILVRHARLKGRDALWVVGTDHAGIATQMVVERQLAERQQKRTDFSREEFVEKVWQWKAESGGEITRQLRRLGCSMDWANEQFTMDPHFVRAVNKVFVDLYNQGLLYRDKRLVNWDPGLKTAISDLEVETSEVAGKFWHFRYPLEDGPASNGMTHISVATTRPETMLADMAVAVNAADERYTALVGRNVRLPITGRLVPIITDDHADPELGSGAVKITPGHDFNDFEVGKRAGFKPGEMLNMLDGEAKVVQTADGLIPDTLLGLDRFAARTQVVALIEGEGLLEKVEDRMIATPFGDRSNAVIEPWLTDQWYVDAKTLAAPAIDAVRNGDIEIVPKSWEKTWFNWMENIQPWCVSRQLWWGHRIPAWYGVDFTVEGGVATPGGIRCFVAENEAEAADLAKAFVDAVASQSDALTDVQVRVATEAYIGSAHGQADPLIYEIWRDEDVLDTWFSSALWPFATLGWPEAETGHPPKPFVPSEVEGHGDAHERVSTTLDTNGEGGRGRSLLNRHYPNDILVSGFDILFFWDARMAMQGLHFMKEVPWRKLYLHGLVRAADGQKMSKSKGNTVDPLGLIDRYGADALRFFMAAMESQGRDIKMDEKRVEGYRNFATKLWNAARFCQSNGIGASQTLSPPEASLPVNRWIVAETVETVQKLDLALADLRFDEAANTIYQFVWSRFCDWYLELIKPVLKGPDEILQAGNELDLDEETAAETRLVAGWVLDQILVMLHPFMPFITEELWSKMGDRPYELILARWPEADARALDAEAREEIDWLIRLVTEIRAARTELGVPPSARLPMVATGADDDRLSRHAPALTRLARVEQSNEASGGGAIQVVVDEATYSLALGEVIDLAAERARLFKGVESAAKERDTLAQRLANPSFVERAKPEAVEKARADHAEKAAEAERLQAALARLG